MKKKGLTFTAIFLAQSANYGEGIGNVAALKKLSRNKGEQYTYISRQAIRYNIIEKNEISEEETIVKNSNDIPITIIYAVAYLHKYTKETQMQELKHLNNIYIISENKYMVLDSIARKNLELTQRMKDRK